MRHVERAVSEGRTSREDEAKLPALPPLASHTLLHYQVTKCDSAYGTLPALRHALFEEGLGICYLMGSWTAVENPTNAAADLVHPNAGYEYIIDCYGEVAEVVGLLRCIVEDAGKPEVRLYQRMAHGSYPPYRRIVL
jgi:hypothetical protein